LGSRIRGKEAKNLVNKMLDEAIKSEDAWIGFKYDLKKKTLQIIGTSGADPIVDKVKEKLDIKIVVKK